MVNRCRYKLYHAAAARRTARGARGTRLYALSRLSSQWGSKSQQEWTPSLMLLRGVRRPLGVLQ